MKPAVPQDEKERLVALLRFDVLDQFLQDELEGIVRLSTRITGAEKAVVNLIDSNRQWQAASIGFKAGECDRDESMCAHTIMQRGVVHAADARNDQRFADNPFVTGVIDDVRMYAAAPLITSDGYAIGTICTFDSRAFELDSDQLEALNDLAQQLVKIFELRLNARLLREANEDLDAFAGVVAHDLRNPITTVNGFAEILESELENAGPHAGQILSRLRGAAGRMATLVDDVLSYSRCSHSELRPERMNLDLMLPVVLENLNALVVQHNAKVEYEKLPEIIADSSQVSQLLQNLVANAIVHTSGADTEVPMVRISAWSGPRSVELYVDDNGPGVPSESREHVFAAFERSGARVIGHGLGLATCKRIAQRHDGHIWIEDSPMGGARFVTSLPQP